MILMQTSESAWYCARTKAKHEHIAAANLKKKLGLEVFHPRLRMERATQRGVMRVVEPLFPCYIFVRCRLTESMESIRHSAGISSLVHFGQRIPVVPDGTIEELRQCFETEEPMAVEDGLLAGAEVMIAEGAFLGYPATVVRALPAVRRVQILLDFLGRPTLAEVDRSSLKPTQYRVADRLPLLAAT
jgi:transcriptional antiterminator RfaH